VLTVEYTNNSSVDINFTYTIACFKRKIVGGQRCCPIYDCGAEGAKHPRRGRRPCRGWVRLSPFPPKGYGAGIIIIIILIIIIIITPGKFVKFYMQNPAF
jgi:hypothetical protein